MEKEEGGGEIIVKATAIIHDSHRPGYYLLALHRNNSADSESNDPGPPSFCLNELCLTIYYRCGFNNEPRAGFLRPGGGPLGASFRGLDGDPQSARGSLLKTTPIVRSEVGASRCGMPAPHDTYRPVLL